MKSAEAEDGMVAAKELKALYRGYSENRITREVYRDSRARILDEAALRYPDIAVPDADATRPKWIGAETSTPQAEAVPAAKAPAAVGRRTPVAPQVMLASVFVLVVAALVMWFLTRSPEGPAATEPALPTASIEGNVSAAAPADRAKSLARKFLFANDWSDSSVRDFVAAWRALTPDERAAAGRSNWMPGLIDTVRRYVQEERSLLAAAGAPPEVSPSLAELAEVFGIDVARLPLESAQVARTDSAPDVAILMGEGTSPVAQGSPATTASIPEVPSPDTSAGPPTDLTPAEPARPPVVADSVATTPAAVSPDQERILAARTETEPALEKPTGSAPGKVASSPPKAGTADAPRPADPCPASLVGKQSRLCRDDLAIGGKGPLLVVIPKGRFRMGSDFSSEEGPPHDVTLAQPIAVGVYEVSIDEYRIFCSGEGRACPDSQGRPGDSPVSMVSWRDANAYAEWLTSQTGQRYRLPTESEWEYAARGGTQSKFPFGDEITSADVAFAGPRPRSAPAARSEKFNKNRFNLLHTVGNVREWVQDDWAPTHQGAPGNGRPRSGAGGEKVVRGGSFADSLDGVRSSSRQPLTATTKDSFTGFRVVRDVR